MTTVDCPYEPCDARVELIVEQRSPDDDESTVNRIKPHQTEPDNWFGACPASLMTYPLEAAMMGPLAEQARVHGHMKATRDAQPQPASAPREPHSRAPKGEANPYWFQDSKPPGGRPAEVPEWRRRPLGYLPGSRPTEGESMASVSDVKAAINQANTLIDEARQAAKQASEKFLEAAAVVNFIQATTVDTLGGSELDVAMQSCDHAVTRAGLAIEKNVTYGGTL